TILETLLAADRTDSVELLTDCVRSALGRMLTQQYCGEDGQLHCVCLESELEGAIGRYVSEGGPAAAAVPPDLAGKLTRTVADGLTRLRRQGRPPVVLCGPPVRVAVRDLIISAHPDAAVLGYNEIDGAEVKPVAKVESQS
ncbi:MAG: FHIPEP family type III secretion protein, partial [Phycisphaerae bacterium]|nr:FHIPEP family type III secretion protein [Phycisphaerae bacterium]